MGLVLPSTAGRAQRYVKNLNIFEYLEWYEAKFLRKTTATLASPIFYFVLNL
jgi:hypothetical protein